MTFLRCLLRTFFPSPTYSFEEELECGVLVEGSAQLIAAHEDAARRVC